MTHSEKTVVLVVDDESLLRMSAVDALEDDGFVTIEAGSASEALEALAAHPEISVLFTDIQMPGGDGLTLAHNVHERRPDVRLIITSGQLRPASADIPDHGRFLAKPYGRHDIADLLREMAA